MKANPFGLKNMLGNVMEYCSDWYAEDAYSQLQDGATDPKGPASGEEHVVRGGLYNEDAAEMRCAARAHTEHDAWLKTDPQNPKVVLGYQGYRFPRRVRGSRRSLGTVTTGGPRLRACEAKIDGRREQLSAGDPRRRMMRPLRKRVLVD